MPVGIHAAPYQGPFDSPDAPFRPGRGKPIRLPILVAAIAGAIVIMALLGNSLVRQFRFLQLYSAGQAGSVYVEGFLAPHARAFLRDGRFPPDMQDQVHDNLLRLPAARQFDLLKIWSIDGRLVFSTLPPDDHETHEMNDLQRAALGEMVLELNEPDEDGAFQYPMLEIYSPILDPVTRKVVAVGEIYQDARPLVAQRVLVERSIWIAVGLATTGMLSMLMMVAAQRRKLERQFAEAQRSAAENDRLRQMADQARLAACEANERLLNDVGAELHDGPIQLVSLLMLASEDASLLPAHRQHDLLSQTMAELRSISSGLILPEIHGLILAQTLDLAIQRHQSLTGSLVESRMDQLPPDVEEPLRVCLYRAVQEGLTNSWRYASGRGQTVEARLDGPSIVVIVRDSGPPGDHPDRPATDEDRLRLGHLGIRNRLDAFGGTLAFHSMPGVGTELVVRVPWAA